MANVHLTGGSWLWLAFLSCLFNSCYQRADHDRNLGVVRAANYEAFWLWAGVKPQAVLRQAQSIYILEGEIRAQQPRLIQRLLAGTPRVSHADIWIVYRTETLEWDAGIAPQIALDFARWRQAGSRVVGVQIDFDAATRGLENYALFLDNLRQQLPEDCRLSITGLMDWSSRADPQGLRGLKSKVDEIVIQTYQGRKTIPGYQNYLAQLKRLAIPYRLGIVQNGQWHPPEWLSSDPNFQGYVVFLLNDIPTQRNL